MTEPITIAIIAAIAGLISGTIASIIAPWINWGIQKKKEKQEQRRILLESNRKIILHEFAELEHFNKNFALGNVKVIYPIAQNYLDTLSKHHEFQQLKPFLEKSTITILEDSKLLELKDRQSELGQIPKPYQVTLDNIAVIERQWDLI